MPRGGARQGAGRPVGAVSEVKRRLAMLAQEHAETAVEALVDVAQNGQSEQARISAAVALLDRGFGKPREATPAQYEAPADGYSFPWE